MSEDRCPPDDPELTRSSPEDLRGTQDSKHKRLGDFELLRELGRGGMGIVYEARQLSLKRRVALKVLPPGLGLTETAVRRFQREAQAAAKLHHTNIVPVYAIDEEQGSHFYVMELIEGDPLSRVLNDLRGRGSNPLLEAAVTRTVATVPGKDDTGEAGEPETLSGSTSVISFSDTSSGSREWFDAVAKLMAEVADALHYAHEQGVIHRDVKPANLMLSEDGRLCLTDFGLALVAQEPGMTVSGSFLGTPAYMSPEQIAAGRVEIDARTDVYSLGAVLYEMLTLQRPFTGESRDKILQAIMTKDPRPPRRYNPRIPVDLETICQRAMEKDRDRRYRSAADLANDLRQYLQRGLITARRAGLARRAWKSIRRHPVAASVTVGILAVVVVGTLGLQQYAGRSEEEALRLVADARFALRDGTYREGLALIDRAVEMDPTSVDGRLVRAQLLMRNIRFRDAGDEALLVLEIEPDNWTAHALLAALARFSSEQYRLVSISAEEHLRVVEKNAPETSMAYYLRALSADTLILRAELLDRALELDPGNSPALVTRIQTAQGLMDLEGALAATDRLIAARPRSSQGWRTRAGTYRGLGDLDKAREAIDRAVALDDRDVWSYIQRSWIHRTAGDFGAAVEDATHAIGLDPGHAFGYSSRASMLNDLGRFEEAVADARKALEINPEGAYAYYHLLDAHLKMDQEDAVREVLDELRTAADGWADPEIRSWAYREIASFSMKIKDHEQALAAVERAIEVDPDEYQNFISRRQIHNALGNAAAAKADCEAAAHVELAEEPAEFSGRGWQMSSQCQLYDEAVSDFTRAIELAPHWDAPYRGRGTAKYHLERHDNALSDLTRAIELNSNESWNHGTRALVLERLRRYDEAIADKERALELRPHDPGAISNLGMSYGRRGRLQDALRQYERALEIDPRHVMALGNSSQIYSFTGRFEEAIEAARRAIDIDPDQIGSKVHDILAQAHLSLDQPDEARAAIEAMLGRIDGWTEEKAYDARLSAAVMFVYLQDLDAALGEAEEAVAIDDERYEAYILRAVVRRRLGDTANWREDCRTAASLELTTAGDLLGRARHVGGYCRLTDAARHDTEKALGLTPDDPEALSLLGELLDHLGKITAARREYDLAIQADSHDRLALLARAQHHAMRGNCEAGAADLAQGKVAGEQDPRSWARIAWIHAVLLATNCPGEYDEDEALDLARRAANYLPPAEWRYTYGALGTVLYRKGQFEEAVEALERALEYSLIEEPETLFFLAMAQSRIGDEDLARDSYSRAVTRMQELAPEWPLLIQLRNEADGSG